MRDRRKRMSGIDALEVLKEKCKREIELREMEIEMKTEERTAG